MPKPYKTIYLDLPFIPLQLICIAFLIQNNQVNYLTLAMVNLIFWFIYMYVEKKEKWEIPSYVRLVTLLSITFNDYLGEYLNLYVNSIPYDRFQHVFGTYALTLWAFFVIQQITNIKFTNAVLVTIFLICLSLSVGSIYEIFEFLGDKWFNPKVKNQPSLIDTDLDLISDLCGGILAAWHFHLSKQLHSFTFPFERDTNHNKPV